MSLTICGSFVISCVLLRITLPHAAIELRQGTRHITICEAKTSTSLKASMCLYCHQILQRARSIVVGEVQRQYSKCSPYSYIVELDGARHHVHANKLRKFHIRVDEVVCGSAVVEPYISNQFLVADICAIVYDRDSDFGCRSVVDPPDTGQQLPPSQKIDLKKLAHLSEIQRKELLDVLDNFQIACRRLLVSVILLNTRFQ